MARPERHFMHTKNNLIANETNKFIRKSLPVSEMSSHSQKIDDLNWKVKFKFLGESTASDFVYAFFSLFCLGIFSVS